MKIDYTAADAADRAQKMNKYIVETHLGAFETLAASSSKALSNVRWRLFGRCGYVKTDYWTIKAI